MLLHIHHTAAQTSVLFLLRAALTHTTTHLAALGPRPRRARFSSLFIHAGFSPAADVKNLVLGEAGHFHLALDDHFWRAPKFHVNPFL
jgi:hypothetical protein